MTCTAGARHRHGLSEKSATDVWVSWRRDAYNVHYLCLRCCMPWHSSHLSFRAWPGIQAEMEAILTWTPARRPEWQIKKQAGMTGREKIPCCDRKELIRRSLDVFLRKRGMTLWGNDCWVIVGWRFLGDNCCAVEVWVFMLFLFSQSWCLFYSGIYRRGRGDRKALCHGRFRFPSV